MLPSAISTLCKKINFYNVQYQMVRYKRRCRKPFWLGTAKSKMFNIPEQPNLPPEEKAELLRLHANYRTAIKSIRGFLREQEADLIEAQSIEVKEEDIEESIAANDLWNAECARLRKERLDKKFKDYDELAINRIEKVTKKQENIRLHIEELVRQEKEKSKDFVTRENLDKKIEECLSEESDFNYAIDLEGNMYTGYEEHMAASPLDLNQVNAITPGRSPSVK